MNKISRFIKVFAALLALILLFSGCSMFKISSVESLLKPPKLTGKNAEIQKAFENAAGKNVTLINPLNGEYRSAFIQYDYDNDSIEEVIVFYIPQGSSGEAHIHFLDYDGNKWISVGDISGSGSEVYSVEFCDIDNNNTSEIAVTWTVSDARINKNLSLYSVDSNYQMSTLSVVAIATVQISDYLFIDMDFDSRPELFYTSFDSSSKTKPVSAKVVKYNIDDKAFYPVSEISLNPAIVSFAGFSASVNDYMRWIYIDCVKADGALFTEVLFFDTQKSALVNPLLSLENDTSIMTSRSILEYCKDENSDSVIEIPVEYTYNDSYVINAPENVKQDIHILDWKQFKNNNLVSVDKYYVNDIDNYLLCVNSFYENSYVVYDYSINTAQFRLKSKPNDSNIIFTVSCQHLSEESSGAVTAKQIKITVTDLGKSINLNQNYIKTLITDLHGGSIL